MHPSRGPDRRRTDSGPPDALPNRRCGVDRRTMRISEKALAEIEAHLARIEGETPAVDEKGSGWDRLVIELD